MKITYDQEADVLYIQLARKRPFDTIEIDADTFYEVDENGRLISLEILSASKKYRNFDKIDFEQYLKMPRKKRSKRLKIREHAAV